VLAIDLQDALVRALDEGDRVVSRSEYLLRVAALLQVPRVKTTQNVAKLGPPTSAIAEIESSTYDKLTFSSWKDPGVRRSILNSGADQIVICGAETHICVSMTAQDLLENGYSVVVCPDAVGASSPDRHKLGMERIRDAGAVPVHSEAVAYEWLETAAHPRFRDVLAVTKSLR